MFQPVSLFVGLRYVRSRTRKFFVSFITWVSLAGVAVGVAALIVVLSVMNGFEGELRDRLLALSSHARVIVAGESGGGLPSSVQGSAQAATRAGDYDWQGTLAVLRSDPRVQGVA
ncbi:MAG: ABC transporter permease, partial [Gammaproteobacteria bacterium]|nr:ABC transporter permease [Gammaproteobacteria bacterium]